MKVALLGVALLMVSACSDGSPCLVEPGCPSSASPPPPVAAVLQISAFSVAEARIPGDYFCDPFCLTPFVQVVEKTGVRRAYIKSITVVGYQVSSSTPQSCPVEPGQHVSLLLGEDAWRSESAIGQERTILVTYDDGTGTLSTLSERTLVTPSPSQPQTYDPRGCRLGNAVTVKTLASSLRSMSP
jgi:hypothetical protein